MNGDDPTGGDYQQGRPSRCSLTPDYVAGFVDGEGCFSVSVHPHPTVRYGTRWLIAPSFHVYQHRDNVEILEKLRSYFGCGRIVPKGSNSPVMTYSVYRRADLESAIIPSQDVNKRILTFRVANGVYGCITPWNFPTLIPVELIAPGIAAGNTIVIKPSEWTPIAMANFMQIMADAGLPDGVVNVVYGAGDVAFKPAAKSRLEKLETLGYGKLPVCIAKTQYSFSDDPKVVGAPVGWTLTISDVTLSAGAGFVVAIAGSSLAGAPGRGRVVRVALVPDQSTTRLVERLRGPS